MKRLALKAQMPQQTGKGQHPAANCGNCRFFCDRPTELEQQFPQLRALGSVYGSVRGLDGLCQLHQRYLMPSSCCEAHEPKGRPEVRQRRANGGE